MNLIQKIFNFIWTRGRKPDEEDIDNQLTSMLNVISTLSSVGGIFFLVLSLLFTDDYLYVGINGFIALDFSLILVFHHFGLVNLARLHFGFIIPLWYVFSIIAIGGNFGQSIVGATEILISYLLFHKRPKFRNFVLFYNFLLYALPTIYVTFYGPIFGLRDYPLDELFVFTVCLGWIFLMISIYEMRKEIYIKNLLDKNRELTRKTNELERFNYIASHDLKSPVRNILNFLGLIRRDYDKMHFDKIDEYLDFTHKSATQLNELIEGVLEISTVDNDTGNFEPIDLNKVLDKVLLNLNREIKEKNVKVISGFLPYFVGSETDFIIVFQNLIQNGLKYNTSEYPVIEINAKKANGFLSIKVKDNGIGIAKENQKSIFQFFKRLHNSTEYKGTGLGLGLCVKIIEKYKGEITIKSELGKYSEFTVSLPLEVLEEQY